MYHPFATSGTRGVKVEKWEEEKLGKGSFGTVSKKSSHLTVLPTILFLPEVFTGPRVQNNVTVSSLCRANGGGEGGRACRQIAAWF